MGMAREHEIDDSGLGADQAKRRASHIPNPGVCPECDGAGITPEGEVCPLCEGSGKANARVGGG